MANLFKQTYDKNFGERFLDLFQQPLISPIPNDPVSRNLGQRFKDLFIKPNPPDNPNFKGSWKGSTYVIEKVKPDIPPVPDVLAATNNMAGTKGGFKLTIPSSKRNSKNPDLTTDLPENLAQSIGNELDKYGLATEAAQILHHPYERQKLGYGYGENAGFRTGVGADYNVDENGQIKKIRNEVSKQLEPSEDRGLFRINNGTFYNFIRDPRIRAKMKNAGIIDSTKFEDITPANAKVAYGKMYDPVLNIKMAKIIYDEQGWGAWYAAPFDFQFRPKK